MPQDGNKASAVVQAGMPHTALASTTVPQAALILPASWQCGDTEAGYAILDEPQFVQEAGRAHLQGWRVGRTATDKQSNSCLPLLKASMFGNIEAVAQRVTS